MKSHHEMETHFFCDTDAQLIIDILSISFDSSEANIRLYQRAVSTTQRHLFQQMSVQYHNLFEGLLRRHIALPKDGGTMNLEAGYIGKAYLTALKSSDKNAPSRVMSINRQALKRMKRMVGSMQNRVFASWVSSYLAFIQMALDHMQYQQNQVDVGLSHYK
ncbi:MAG: hypothetical protein ACTIM4_14920 [Marinomonas sp.]